MMRTTVPEWLAANDIRWAAGAAVLAMICIAAIWHLLSPSTPATNAREAAVSLAALPARPESLPAQAPVLLPEDEARARNAAVPFADTDRPAARPFAFQGSPLDQQRATDCLALAAMAEAGESDQGQRAVIQVVLNRVRHPAFVRSVCGVVFQGSQRATGCQFTFTCDGSLRRRYSEAAWAASRQRAREALGGAVYAPVGMATHYHTDWVFPYWSPELDKIARVDTHLFFRWRGFWGTRDAATVGYNGNEPAIAALTALASHAGELADPADLAAVEGAPQLRHDGGSEVVVRHPNGRAFFVHLGVTASAEAAVTLSQELCAAGTGRCQVMAWTDRGAVPIQFPLPPSARGALTFTYVREADGREIVFYDCRQFPAVARERCMPRAAARVS